MARTNKNPPKLHRLLLQLKSKPMTYTEIHQYLAKLNPDRVSTELWNPSLYGTNEREGVLERFCRKNTKRQWYVPEGVTITAPFTPTRY